MVDRKKASLQVDLEQFNLRLDLPGQQALSLQFDTPSRRFYLSVMALVLDRMKKAGKVSFVPLESHADVLAILNETVGGSVGSSEMKNLLPRIYRKWKDALSDLESAPLFRVAGRKKEYNGAAEKSYAFGDNTKDVWANLFAYQGSRETVSLRLCIDRLGMTLDDVTLIYGSEELEGEAPWDRFMESLKRKTQPEPEQTIGKPPEPEALSSDPEKTHREKKPQKGGLWNMALPSLLILMALISLFFGLKSLMEPSGITSAKPVQIASAPVQEKPSIAVLPFTNMSGDPNQDYIADGISENIISALSRIGEIFVIARNSTFTYKNKAVKVQQVAEDLGIRYVLEGSVMKSGDKIRVTAQLIDAISGYHLWAEKFDGNMSDFFQMLDEITREIAVALQIKLTHGEQVRKWYVTTNFEAWGEIAKGIGMFETYTKANNENARAFFENAVQMDPDCAFAWMMLGATHFIDVRFAFNRVNPGESFKKAFQFTEKARSIDETLPDVPALLGSIYLIQRQYDKAVFEGQKSIELGPNSALSHVLFAQTLYYAGNPEGAIAMGEQALRLCPKYPAWYAVKLGRSYSTAGRHQDAIRLFKHVLVRARKGEFPLWLAHSHLAITYSMMGQDEKARFHLAETIKLNPGYSLGLVRKINFYKDPKQLEAIFEALRKAGLPDKTSPAAAASPS